MLLSIVAYFQFNLQPPEKKVSTEAELLQLKLIHLFARDILSIKKLEIEETTTT